MALANAPGTGIADDKVIYAYVDEDDSVLSGRGSIIPNVPTYVCQEEDQRRYVLEHLDQARGQGGQRVGWLWHADRAALDT